MNNIFQPKRFGNYMLHDLKNAKDNYLYSFIITAALPVLTFILVELVAILFSEEHSLCEYSEAVQYLSVFAAFISAIVAFPIKQYGRITDKRYGTSWVMLPASGFEKWLSLIIMTCVVLPVCLFTIYLGLDWVMSAVFPNLYPDPITSYDSIKAYQDALEEAGVTIDLCGLGWLSWAENILIFTLGAVIFKKSKFPKTLLCVMAAGMIFSAITVALFGTGHIGPDNFEEFVSGDPETVIRKFKTFVYVLASATVVLLSGGIYLRITKIQH